MTLIKDRCKQVQQVRQEQQDIPPVGAELPLEGELTGK